VQCFLFGAFRSVACELSASAAPNQARFASPAANFQIRGQRQGAIPVTAQKNSANLSLAMKLQIFEAFA
jgi:hypothetical protein